MGKTEAIQIWRGLSIYKQPMGRSRGSPFWYARVYMPIDGKTVHSRTTLTTDQRRAERFARSFWEECQLRSGGEARVRTTSAMPVGCTRQFDRIVDGWLDETQRDSSAIAQSGNHRTKKQLLFGINGLATFFAGDDIASITTDRISDYLRFQLEKSRYGKLAAGTQKKALSALSLILKYAVSKGMIVRPPVMPKVGKGAPSFSWFTNEEYIMLQIGAWRQCNATDLKAARKFAELSDFVMFMINTFLRSSEWAMLRHSHIRVHGPDNPYLEINVAKSKAGTRTVISLPAAVDVYKRIVARRDYRPDGYVFSPQLSNRVAASERMHNHFDDLLRITGLKKDSLGRNRVIHSLRHSAIMFCLIEGMDHQAIAHNAGTSVREIERMYANRLKVAINIDELCKTTAEATEKHLGKKRPSRLRLLRGLAGRG